MRPNRDVTFKRVYVASNFPHKKNFLEHFKFLETIETNLSAVSLYNLYLAGTFSLFDY